MINIKSFSAFFQTHYQAYWILCKPRVVALMILTSMIGMLLASPTHLPFPWKICIVGNAGIALMAFGAAAINHLIDRHYDAKMQRTAQRPLPTFELTAMQAGTFALILSVLGFGLLITQINTLTAMLTLLTFIGYAFIYTAYLKHATSQNIVIGGLSGAMPPLLGWTAITHQLNIQAWVLVLIIFIWTPPHFWALAIHRQEDYVRAKIPMLPNTHGIDYTKLQILLYTCLLFVVSLLPICLKMVGMSYLISVLILNSGFLWLVIQLYSCQNLEKIKIIALKIFRFSILYLTLLFLFLFLFMLPNTE